jgi:hypothetical protein
MSDTTAKRPDFIAYAARSQGGDAVPKYTPALAALPSCLPPPQPGRRRGPEVHPHRRGLHPGVLRLHVVGGRIAECVTVTHQARFQQRLFMA